MKSLTITLCFILVSTMGCVNKAGKQAELPEHPNFLIFFVDDLRPELGCYGASHIHSPNIDKLASEGLMFNRAYCNVPVCGASRASILTGIRPTPQRFVGYDTRADEDLPGHISLPGYFKDNGYYTLSYGKIFHHQDDSRLSWSEPAWRAKPTHNYTWQDYINPENIEKNKPANYKGRSSENAPDAPDSAYIDGKTANAAVKKLQSLAKQDQPFMFWIGYLKPHLPFNAPSKYWDLYDREDIQLAKNPHRPLNAPDQALHNFGELRNYSDIPETGPLSDEKAAELIHGYYACVSYTDALIGQVMDELERLGLADNTIVAIFGDHGWNLGEHGLWCKHCNFNTSLQVPLIIKVPGTTNGGETDGLSEFVDLFPTMAEMANLEVPEWTEGKSLLPLIKNPAREWKEPVYSRYVLGNSMVTENFIYTEFMQSRRDCTIVANMLYDHRTDPDENNNIAGEPEWRELIESLSLKMNEIHLGK
ncbi:MAG: sulfatase [Bacteroidales bacterium]